MKIRYFYLISLLVVIVSCNNLGKKQAHSENNVSVKKVDTLKADVTVKNIDTSEVNIVQERSMLKKKMYASETIKRDTVINNIHISYTIQDNDEIITTPHITEELDTMCYAGTEVILDVKYPLGDVVYKKINRAFFASYIPNSEIHKYFIHYFKLNKVNNNELVFSVGLSIPDSDIGYWFELYVTNTDDIKIKEIIEDYDSDTW